jgi:hypothetical protein
MMNKDMLKLDEAGGLYFTRQLEYVKAKVIEEKLRENDYARFLPVSAEMPLGASNFTWRSYKGYGQARMISDYAKDFPRVELGASENTVTPKNVGASYAWTLMEIRRAQYANVDLETRKAMLARRVIDEKINALAWHGDANFNIQGFIKYPGTTEFTLSGTLPADKLWSGKTADEILGDLNGIKITPSNLTNGIERINTILIPPAQMDLIKNLRVGTASDTTVYEFFTRNNSGITLEETYALKGAGTGGTDMMIAYNKSPEQLTFELPMPFEQLDAQLDGLEWKVPCLATVVGCIVYYSLSIAWAEGI